MGKANLIKAIIISDCMSPFICKNDMIIVEPCEASDIKVGDVVLLEGKDDAIINVDGKNKKPLRTVHRIVGRKTVDGREYLAQKGDVKFSGSLIEYEQIVGKVILIVKEDYQIDLKKSIWKRVNFTFAVRAILEYNVAIFLNSLFWFLPKRTRYYGERKLFAIGLKLHERIFKASMPLLRDFYSKKQ